MEQFLEQTRQKFVGFKVSDDTQSLAGLPKPIHEGVRVLKDHLYVSLAEHQIKREEEITKNPLSKVFIHVHVALFLIILCYCWRMYGAHRIVSSHA